MIPERWEINEVSPTTAPSLPPGESFMMQCSGQKLEEARQTLCTEEMSQETKEVKKARVHRIESWRGECCFERSTDLRRVPVES